MPKLRIVFKQANPDYNQSYANQYFEGKESPGNSKYTLSVIHLFEVETFELHKNVVYNFIGATNDNVNISSIIKNMNILKFTLTNGEKGDVVVSKNLIKRILRGGKKNEEKFDYYFYFNERTDYKRIDSLMYLLYEDIPQDVRKYFI